MSNYSFRMDASFAYFTGFNKKKTLFPNSCHWTFIFNMVTALNKQCGTTPVLFVDLYVQPLYSSRITLLIPGVSGVMGAS